VLHMYSGAPEGNLKTAFPTRQTISPHNVVFYFAGICCSNSSKAFRVLVNGSRSKTLLWPVRRSRFSMPLD
jgi:hypothetical protein